MATSIQSLNPATEEVLADLPITTPDQIQKAVKKSFHAFESWKALSYADRAKFVLKARDIMLAEKDSIMALITKEAGKPLTESLSADLLPVMDLATYFAKKTSRLLKRESICLGKWNFMGRTSYLDYEPLGPVGIIAPWNYPFSIPAGQVIMALMAGNTVILKPSELTPLIGLKIGDIFTRAGLPEGVLQVIVGDGSTGAALVSSGLKKIFFTGSVATGKRIMEAASKTLTPVCLELGGKDPMIVLEDADLDVASSGLIWGAFSNSGQTCSSVERLYVHESVAEKFMALCEEKTKQLRQGDPSGDVELGSMASSMQRDKVMAQVEEARVSGAKITVGGVRPAQKGYYYPPTIIRQVNHSMSVMKDETFGPVVGMMTFKTEEDAVRMANDSHYGLTASIWTKNISRGRRLARDIIAGTVMINENLYTYALAQTPWGGPKESGIGRTHGKHGIMEMVEMKHVHINYLARVKDFWWFPYHGDTKQALVSLSNILFQNGLFNKIKAVADHLKAQINLKKL